MGLLATLQTLKSDESLMLAYQAGKFSSFEVLYKRYKDSLYRFFKYHCAGNSQGAAHAEDLAQDTWAAIINRVEHYQATAKFKTYLFTVARNKLIDFYRRYGHLENHCDSFDDEAIDNDRQYRKSQPSEQEQQLHQQQLLRQLDKLPIDQRQAFILKEEGFSVAEIASISDVNTETIKSRLRYARTRLKQLLTAAEVQL
tara:strand:+ start:3253 stop:3849 length:597 start_codon:yes stop_codon:yes gene_type:complete